MTSWVEILKKYFNHTHNFQLVGESRTFESPSDPMPYKHTKTYMCKECGKVKKINY